MPTPSKENQIGEYRAPNEEWAARPAERPRSIFGNYSPRGSAKVLPPAAESAPANQRPIDRGSSGASSLQTEIDRAIARSFLYRFLAQAYEDPTPEGWEKLRAGRPSLEPAVESLAPAAPALAQASAAFLSELEPAGFEPFLIAYLAAFGHAARGRCPLNEIEYGDIKADPLFQPHRLADLAAFYRAFGLEVAADADERHDHICLELEFMCVLAAKEAYALEHQLDLDDLAICRDAQKRFLREHLARWTPAFTRRLARMTSTTTVLGALANLTLSFIQAECVGHGVTPGSEDLLLRPVDEVAESMCDSCGPRPSPPEALPQG